MDKTTPQTFSSVISVNPYKGTYFTGKQNRLTPEANPAFSKEQYVISYLNTKSFITALIEISKNIPDEDVFNALENKIYDELALDMAIEYQIQYVEAPSLDENNRSFHVFVVDPLTLEEEFAEPVEKLKYIDQIIPVPLLMKSLYTKEIIEDHGVHCYLYFQDNDAFFTIYNDQEFVYTKSLKFSFKQMHERFSELLGEKIEHAVFLELLSKEGLSSGNTEYQKYLIKLFGEIFLHINDVMTYAKRAFEIERIDQIYLGSQIGAITGLDEYSQTYLGLTSSQFDFDYGFESEAFYIDQIHALMHLYTQLDPEERYECNFSIYHRPPPFMQRNSGKLIMLTAASLIAAMAYPVTFWSLDYAEGLHASFLSNEYKTLHNVKVTRENTIKLKEDDKARAQKLLDAEKKEFEEKKGTLEKIHDVKVNYPMKAKILTEFTKEFNRFKVNLTNIAYAEEAKSGKAFTFMLNAKTDKDITALLEYLTKARTGKYQFLLEKISFDEDKSRYNSEMKAVLR